MERAKKTSMLAVITAISAVVSTGPVYARKTNQPIYEDPFDLAAGGASLTRASKEARLFSNPALLPIGGKFHYWSGLTLTAMVNKESVDTARFLYENRSGGGGEDDAAAEDPAAAEEESQTGAELVERATSHPVHIGMGAALSWITKYFGLSLFSSSEVDVRVRPIGDTGTPEVRAMAESYSGAAIGTAVRTPWRWLSFGLTGKHIMALERETSVDISDEAAVAEFTDSGLSGNYGAMNRGTGFDVGMLMFFQGNWFDFSLAGKVDNVGDTQMAGDGESPTVFKQVVSAGTAITFHTGADALHLALDYRDILGAYQKPPTIDENGEEVVGGPEETFKKVYAGTKLLLRTYIGLAAGFYQGYPTMGAELDLIFMRIAVTSYAREYGDHPGADPRRIYMGSLSMGF